jgi:hypothetical protein
MTLPIRAGVFVGVACALVLAAMSPAVAPAMGPAVGTSSTVVYDNFDSPYKLANYQAKWSNIYGLGDMAVAPGDTRSFTGNVFQINDAPFRTANDFSVFDHLKYIAISKPPSFDVPAAGGSLTFSSQINAKTPGTQPGRIVTGTYGPPGSYASGAPYAAPVFEGQQAGAVMNMINFDTGQLFDWFISGTRAFTLVERLPSTVTGNTTDPSSPDWVGPGKMYTQIVNEFAVKPGMHTVSIRYTRSAADPTTASVQFLLDGTVATTVDHVGLPLDSPLRASPPAWTGVYPSATFPGGGPAAGEELGAKISNFVIGHGTFSLLDAFPYQWGWGFDATGNLYCQFTGLLGQTCAGSVSIPPSQRLFGQGVKATFDNFTVTTTTP